MLEVLFAPHAREAALWFGVGGAVAAFVAAAVLLLASVAGTDTTNRLARAVGTRFDKLAGLEPPRLPPRREYRLVDARIAC